jgi:hypothetical protein
LIGSRLIAQHLTHFAWSCIAKNLIIKLVAAVLFAFVSFLLLAGIWSTIVGLVLLLITSAYCLRHIIERIGPEHRIYNFVAKILLVKNA